MLNDNENDFYKILEIDKTATAHDIRVAYRNMVLKFHPDKNPNQDTTDKFRKIQIAYESLISNRTRQQYDSFDEYKNNNTIKDLFMHYQELLKEICDMYDINDTDRSEILQLFDPTEIDTMCIDDRQILNKIILEKIITFAPKYILKNFYKEHPFIATPISYLVSWLDPRNT